MGQDCEPFDIEKDPTSSEIPADAFVYFRHPNQGTGYDYFAGGPFPSHYTELTGTVWELPTTESQVEVLSYAGNQLTPLRNLTPDEVEGLAAYTEIGTRLFTRKPKLKAPRKKEEQQEAGARVILRLDEIEQRKVDRIPPSARRYLEKALEFGEERAAGEICQTAIELGNLPLARKMLPQSSRLGDDYSCLQIAVRVGEIRFAKEIARQIKDLPGADIGIKAWAEIGASGDPEAIHSATTSAWSHEARCAVAQMLARLGKWDDATRWADGIGKNEVKKEQPGATLIRMSWQTPKTWSEDIPIERNVDRSATLAEVATAAIDKHRTEVAREIAPMIGDAYHRALVRAGIAQETGNPEDLEAARLEADAVRNSKLRVKALKAVADAGDPSAVFELRETAESVWGKSQRAEALLEAHQAGDPAQLRPAFQEALKTAESITMPDTRRAETAKVIKAAIKRGQTQDVWNILEERDFPDWGLDILIELDEAGHPYAYDAALNLSKKTWAFAGKPNHGGDWAESLARLAERTVLHDRAEDIRIFISNLRPHEQAICFARMARATGTG